MENAKITYSAEATAVTIGYNAPEQEVTPAWVPDTDDGTVTLYRGDTAIGTDKTLTKFTVKDGEIYSASGGACVFQVKIQWDYANQEKPLSIYHWVDMADSLGDITLHTASATTSGIKGDYKYSRVIADKTGMRTTYLSAGGCGFYKGGGTAYGTGNTVAVRAAQVPHDADIVTLWGSYNDQVIYAYTTSNTECDTDDAWYGQPTFGRIPICMDNDGRPVWKNGVGSAYLYGGKALTATVLKECPLNETLTGIDGTPAKKTFVAYVNEAVHTIRRRAPFAKIRYVSGGYCRNNGEGNQMWRNIQYLLWEMACRSNTEWLNLLWCAYPGKGYPAGYTDTIAQYRVGTDNNGNSVDYRSAVLNQGNPYKDFISGWGLSYGQANSDHSIAADPAASDLYTVAYGWWQSPGHPNDDYHEQFHAPVVCEYLCRQLGVDVSCLPERIRATRQEITYVSGYTEYGKLANQTPTVTGVSLDKSAFTLGAGSTETITATVAPSTAAEKRVIWTSSNDFVATVDSYGVVTAQNPGTVTIMAVTADGGKRATAIVTVPAEPDPEPTVYRISVMATGCTVSGASTITEGGTATLTATADSGYSLPDAVTVTGAAYTWDKANGVLALSSPTGVVSVTVTAVKEAVPEPIPIQMFDRNGNRIELRDRLWVKSSAGMIHPAHIYDRSENKIEL